MLKSSKKLTLYISFAVVVAVLGLVLWLNVFNKGQLNLKFNESGVFSVNITSTSGEASVVSDVVEGQSYSVKLPAGAYEVSVFSKDGRGSLLFVSVPGLLKTTVNEVVLNKQNNRSKVSKNSRDCSTADSVHSYSFTCGFSNGVLLHTPTSSAGLSTTSRLNLGKVLDVQSYLSGLLILKQGALGNVEVSYVTNDSVVKTISVPSPDDNKTNFTHSINIDRSGSGKFMITRHSDIVDVVFYDNIDDTPKLLNVSNPDFFGEGLISKTSLYEESFMLAVGRPSFEQHENTETAPSQTKVYIFETANVEKIIYQTSLNESLLESSLCASGVVCINHGNKLTILPYSKNLPMFQINDVSGFANVDTKTVDTIIGDSVFRIDPINRTGRMVFKSSNFIPKSISFSNRGSVLNTQTVGTNTKTDRSIFIIDNETSQGDVFIDNILPYNNSFIPELWDMDFSGKTIFVSLLLNSSFYDATTDAASYDKPEYTSVTNSIIDRLNNDGITTPPYNIVFDVIF